MDDIMIGGVSATVILVIVCILVAVVFFWRTETDYRQVEDSKGEAPTPALAAANAGQGCIYWLSWIAFVGFLVLMVSFLGGVVMIGGV